MLIYVGAVLALWLAFNVLFVIWMGSGSRRSSNPDVEDGERGRVAA